MNIIDLNPLCSKQLSNYLGDFLCFFTRKVFPSFDDHISVSRIELH